MVQSEMLDLSIIVVCHKGWERLRKCLESLYNFKGDKFRFEVIVVDNNSGDGYFPEIEKQFPGFCFIRNKINGGYAHGNNLGSKSAGGEFILILNPDTVSEEREIEKLLQAARLNPEYNIISCRQINEMGRETNAKGDFPSFFNLTGFQRSLLKIVKSKKGECITDEPVIFPDWISGSVVLIKKELYKQMDGFFEGFWMYYEDVDLCKRVYDRGGKIAFFRNIIIEHNHGGSSRFNTRTTSITKAEVMISQHLYISRNMKGFGRFSTQFFLIINNIISGAFPAIIGLFLFYVPKIFVRTIIFIRILKYYTGSIFRRTWISPRSVMLKPVIC